MTASEVAALIRRGELKPADVVREALERIHAIDDQVGAFEVVRTQAAIAEAEALSTLDGLDALPLAGVPVAIKDDVDVAGEPTRFGSAATDRTPASADDELVRRLRAAGAVVVGKTRVPELMLRGASDNPRGVTRNPWDLSRTAGGSSGGSGAAVAAGMVPLALGSDGFGSIRIPAAACGLVGLKPGAGVVPGHPERWFGLSEWGPLARTVDDAALMFDVLADQPPRPLDGPRQPLRIAASTQVPLPGMWPSESARDAVQTVANALAQVGHHLHQADPPIQQSAVAAVTARWLAVATEGAAGLDRARLEPFTRRHAQLGGMLRRLVPIREEAVTRWHRRMARWFAGRDILITPALTRQPPLAGPRGHDSWLANVIVNSTLVAYLPAWNLVRFPAMSVPAPSAQATPVGVQLVAAPGREALLLSLAAQIEQLLPWPRLAPTLA